MTFGKRDGLRKDACEQVVKHAKPLFIATNGRSTENIMAAGKDPFKGKLRILPFITETPSIWESGSVCRMKP